MNEAFGLYIARPSFVHRLHPITKLVMAAAFLLIGLALPGGWFTFGLFLFGLLPLAAWAQVARELVSRSLRIVLPFAISVFLIQGFLWPQGTPVYSLGPLTLKREGLAFSIASTGRILALVSAFLWFTLTTRPDRLMSALVQRGLPPSLAYLIVASLQIIPRFQARAAAILDAQQARGLAITGGFARRARAVLPLVVPLILSSLIDVEERALAIEARAFNFPIRKTSFVEIPQSAWEPALRWILALITVAVISISLWARLAA